jgi:hypothetical protein
VLIEDTRKCNLFNLAALARYLGSPSEEVIGYYDELSADRTFLDDINRCIAAARKRGFTKGIFRNPGVDSIDWFAFERVLIYVLIRHFKPQIVLETGIYYGGNSAFALRALARNQRGRMISIDLPDSQVRQRGDARHSLVGDTELYDPSLRPGFMVPENLRERWEPIEGDSLAIIPTLSANVDLYLHDSDHSMSFLSSELAAAWPKLTDSALILVDDIDWSNAFFAFCIARRLYPLLLTDNGKDDLRVRTGLAVRGHPRNGDPNFT